MRRQTAGAKGKKGTRIKAGTSSEGREIVRAEGGEEAKEEWEGRKRGKGNGKKRRGQRER